MVLRYETGLRGVLVQVPRPDLEPACLHFMQLTLVSSINNRLLRAHRPFMVRGYSDSRFAHSRAAALDSARSIIATQRLMMACPQYRPTCVPPLRPLSPPTRRPLTDASFCPAASSTDGSWERRS